MNPLQPPPAARTTAGLHRLGAARIIAGMQESATSRANEQRYAGGCLCGAVRYEALGAPLYSGLCFCADCRKVSGGGFVGFMGFAASALSFRGETRIFTSPAWRGGEAVRNSCPMCASLLFGGRVGIDTQHTVYAGSLDDPSLFKPQIAIFTRDRPAWALIPEGLKVYERMPG
jgi:hypothetical protein